MVRNAKQYLVAVDFCQQHAGSGVPRLPLALKVLVALRTLRLHAHRHIPAVGSMDHRVGVEERCVAIEFARWARDRISQHQLKLGNQRGW